MKFHLADDGTCILLRDFSPDTELPAHLLGKLIQTSTLRGPLPDAGSRAVAYEYLSARNM